MAQLGVGCRNLAVAFGLSVHLLCYRVQFVSLANTWILAHTPQPYRWSPVDPSYHGVLLCHADHVFDFLGRAALVVGDGDAVRLSCGLVGRGDVQHTVGIVIQSDLDLRDTTGGGGDARELEPPEYIVVLGAGTLTFVNLDEDTGLVVGISGKYFGLLCGDSSVSLDEGSHDAASGLDTDGLGIHVKPKQVPNLLRGVTGQNNGLDGCPIGGGLVRVDAFAGGLSVEEMGNGLGDAWDTGRATDQDDLMNVGLVDLGITEDLLDWLEGASDEVLAQVLEMVAGEGGVEVDALEEILDLDGGRGRGGEGSLGTLTCGTETAESPRVRSEVTLVFAVKLLDKMVDDPTVKILAAQVGVTGGGLHLEDTLLDGQEGDIEISSTHIKDEDAALVGDPFVETVGNSSSRRLVYDADDV